MWKMCHHIDLKGAYPLPLLFYQIRTACYFIDRIVQYSPTHYPWWPRVTGPYLSTVLAVDLFNWRNNREEGSCGLSQRRRREDHTPATWIQWRGGGYTQARRHGADTPL